MELFRITFSLIKHNSKYDNLKSSGVLSRLNRWSVGGFDRRVGAKSGGSGSVEGDLSGGEGGWRAIAPPKPPPRPNSPTSFYTFVNLLPMQRNVTGCAQAVANRGDSRAQSRALQ